MAISDFATHEPWDSHQVLSTALAHRKQERDILNGQQSNAKKVALLLAPHAAHLFEGGFISFEADGTLLIRNEVVEHSLEAWGLPLSIPLTPFRAEQHVYLSYHREHVFGSSVDESTQ